MQLYEPKAVQGAKSSSFLPYWEISHASKLPSRWNNQNKIPRIYYTQEIDHNWLWNTTKHFKFSWEIHQNHIKHSKLLKLALHHWLVYARAAFYITEKICYKFKLIKNIFLVRLYGLFSELLNGMLHASMKKISLRNQRSAYFWNCSWWQAF